MKDIKDLPITIQIALALKTPELFNKEQYERLMKVKNITWNTGTAAERFRHNLKLNKKRRPKPKAPSSKPQAPSAIKKTQLNNIK